MKSIADESTRASTANSVEERGLWLIIILSVGTMLLYAFRRSQRDIEPKEVGVTPMSTRDKMQAELLRSREELAHLGPVVHDTTLMRPDGRRGVLPEPG